MASHPGTAGTAVLVHGSWSSPADWRFVEELLTPAGVTVCTPDLPSHRGRGGTRADDVAEVQAAVDAAAGPVVAVGWSYGGWLLSDLELRGVDVARLVYVAAIPQPLPGAEDSPPSAEPDLTHVTFADDGTFCLDNEWWVTEGEVTSCSAVVLDHLRAHPRRPQTLESVLAGQSRTAWKDVATTVLLGRNDSLCPEPTRDWASNHLDDVRLIDSDHFIPFRAPDIIAEVVVSALA